MRKEWGRKPPDGRSATIMSWFRSGKTIAEVREHFGMSKAWAQYFRQHRFEKMETWDPSESTYLIALKEILRRGENINCREVLHEW